MNDKTKEIMRILSELYPNAKPRLDFSSNFELLIAVILSAQCTDNRVNIVTKTLFEKYKTPEDILKLKIEELEDLIKSCGFYHMKAKNIMLTCKTLVDKFNSTVPESYDDLLSLHGVGRKTANVVSSVAFDKDCIAVDTHVFRVSRRLGLSNGNTPYKVEMDLKEKIDVSLLKDAHHWIIFHGREVCKAQKPRCKECKLNTYCEYYKGVNL